MNGQTLSQFLGDPRVGAVPVIEMRDVVVGALRDPRVVVAEQVNWRVEPGEFWVVAGLHGSGKTDFMMLSGGVMAPLRGSYEFMGEEMPIFSEERLAQRLRLGLVFDGGRLLNHLTVAENIALPLRYHFELAEEEIEAMVGVLLGLIDMAAFSSNHPANLGPNWQQRAALARALALKPDVLLLDSPLTGLDQRQQNWWLGFLSQLSQGHPYYGGKPVTLVVTTANLRDWQGRANRFALLEGSQFKVLGTWEDVERNQDSLVRELRMPGVREPVFDRPA